jgi:signal transduction histidine kinase
VGLSRTDEIGVVGAAFDDMAARVEQLVLAEKELLANVSHELRTPLARIRVAVALAAEGDRETSRAALEEIGTDVAELSVLLDGIFTTTRLAIDARGEATSPTDLVVDREAVAADLPVRRAVERFRARHPTRTVEIHHADDLASALVVADVALAVRALGNLLENAEKYSRDPTTSITVSATLAGDDVVYEIHDRGIGIAAADLPRVFDPFFRGGAPGTAPTVPGVGMGLALVKRIAAALEGRVEITSVERAGTRARLYLPRA